MRHPRLRSAFVVGRRQLFEAISGPGAYASLSLGLCLAYFVITGFADSVDSGGFDPALSPHLRVLHRALTGVFGPGLTRNLLAEGPAALALLVGWLPAAAYAGTTSVIRFGLERAAGAIELIVFGPADGTAYAIGSLGKDVVLQTLILAATGLFIWGACAMVNLSLGPLFLCLIPVLVLLAAATAGWGAFLSAVARHAASALAAFLGVFLLFTLILAGSWSAVEGPIKAAVVTASAAVQWVSPLYWSAVAVSRFQGADVPGYLAASAALLAVTAGLLTMCHAVFRIRGVRQ